MNKTLVAILAMALVPTALAHDPVGTPNPQCNSTEATHDYAGAGVYDVAGRGFGFVTVQDGCADVNTDNDFEFGIGGGFLPYPHHSGTVCVEDAAFGQSVEYVAGADLNGDFVIDASESTGVVSGCNALPAGPGADGGWWVFVISPATVGHIWTQ
ncbi:MAG TPA: hypothetical protein VNX21_07605 [Candidatus Thermoplasmatota archaeon]|nr:hypothetical protein [Candidatus Thermoplasmatota archaeon]